MCAANDGHTGAGPGAPAGQELGEGLGAGLRVLGGLPPRVGLGAGAEAEVGAGDGFGDVGDGVGRGEGVGVGDVGEGVGAGEVGEGVGLELVDDDEGSGVGDADVGLGLGDGVAGSAAMAAGQNATVPATSRPGSTVRRTREVQRRLAATDIGRRNLALKMMALHPDRPARTSMGEPLQAD